MSRKERWQFFLTWLCLGLLPLFLRPLWEPDEARYAEIPREMLALGDWLTPRLNFVLYFEKPPLQYWLSALSMKVFGHHAVVARLPLALATFISMGAAYLLARRMGARRPIWAAFMTATTILGFISAQILTLDALFSACLVASLALAVEGVVARFEERQSLGWTLGAFLAAACGMLTKGLAGPVLLGGIMLASLPFAWKNRKLRNSVARVFFDPAGWLLFLVVSMPWFWFVERANPGHARFFFVHEHFARFTSNVHLRQGAKNPILDKLYFVGVLLVGLLPWLTSTVVGLRRGWAFAWRRKGPLIESAPLHRWVVAFTVMAFAVPFLFFSASGSKLTQYVLPVLVPLAALACSMEREGEEGRALHRHGLELLTLGVIIAFVTPFLLKSPGCLPWVMGLGVGFILLALWAFRPVGLTTNRWMVVLGLLMLSLTLVAKRTLERDKSTHSMINRAPKEAQWISAGYYYQAIPLQTGRRVVVVGGTGELAFGRNRLTREERDLWFHEDLRSLNPVAREMQALAPNRPVWALIDCDGWARLDPSDQGAWDVVDRTRAAYLARLR